MLPKSLGVLAKPAYRRLWLAQCVSLVGDWFTLIALAVVVSRETRGSGLAVGGLLLTQLLPTTLAGPYAGVLVDRYDRRLLLVVSDVLRAGVVLLLVPAVHAGSLEWVYALSVLHFTVATVFEPARSALVPHLVSGAELVAATTLSTVTWSVMTAVGGALGGSLLAALGVTAAFVLDALSFAASAWLIASIEVPPALPVSAQSGSGPGLLDGVRFALARPSIGAVLLVKSIAGLGFVDTFLVIFATRVFAVGEGGGASLGLLWSCFGIGALLGPTLLNLVSDGSVRHMRRLIAVGALCITGGLTLLSLAPTLAAAGLALVVRGMGGATNWTYSTLILQKVVPDRLRGRLFAMDLACLTLTASAASLLWGLTIDRAGVRVAVRTAAAVCGVAALAWTASLRPMERRDDLDATTGD